MDDIKEELEQIKRLLITKFNPLAIILFGSYSRNSQREDSDIDIAMIANETSKNELFVMKSNLEEQVKREAFILLEENNIIDSKMSKNMQGMVGFRNMAVHDYKEIDEEILKDVIENHLNDLLDFARILL